MNFKRSKKKVFKKAVLTFFMKNQVLCRMHEQQVWKSEIRCVQRFLVCWCRCTKKFAPCHALTQIPLFVSQPAVFALFTFLLRFLMLPVVGAKRVGQSEGILGLKANFLSTARTPSSFQSSVDKNYARECAHCPKIYPGPRFQWKLFEYC
jgi:hypothetical protein